jgi:hypothetical protein
LYLGLFASSFCLGLMLVAASAHAIPQRGPDGRANAIQVGPNVLVSRDDQASGHLETQLGVSATDPKQLVACSIVDQFKLAQRGMHTATYVSNDGGATWKMGAQIPESGDPVCLYGPDGAIYFGAIGDSPNDDKSVDWYFRLYRSRDQGKSWEQKSRILTGDRPWLAFDTSSGPNHGWLYLSYQSRAGVLDSREKEPAVSLDVTHSADSGLTWSFPKASGVINGSRLMHSVPTSMAMLSDGTAVISNWQSLKRRTMDDNEWAATLPYIPGPPTCEITVTFVDPDGWKRATPATKAADKYCSESSTTRTADTLTVDDHSAAFKDRIYLAWADLRSGHSRIMFTYSPDRGSTWAKPRVVDDVPPHLGHSPDNFLPTLAVNKDGIVGLTWEDRRENPDNIGYATRFTASFDGGETWLPSVRVAEQQARFRQGSEGEAIGGRVSQGADGNNPITIAVTRGGEFHGGDTAGLRGDANGVFHAVWIDNRSGIDEVYTAPITVTGTVAKHGSADLAALSDLTGSVAFDLQDTQYDAKTQTITVQGALRNRSKEPLRGRLIGRVLSVTSEAGVATITNADNGFTGPGAVFDFTDTMDAGVLKPDQSTKAKTFHVQLKDVKLPAVEEKNIWKVLELHFVDIDMEILGEPSATGDQKK